MMGVPKFFRWISARYPCINQVIYGDEVPEVDHFYLDMNGILHTCSHPDDSFGFMPEETIFHNIECYILFLVQLIKPQKTLFLAVDGVAPRAKMTQQRARRFQSAQETRIAKENAEKQGQQFKEDPFDPCVISPGTEFMERLHTFLQKVVREQITRNETWRRIDVILSGHDCPGEGEHKIREYMSYRRSQPDYRPNERHCIYGMDADLIFLGLTTHEINLCVLRENVVKSRTCTPDRMPFCVTHLSILREYIDIEFRSLKENLPFPYDLEHIIDDWIFMAFLLGNDFIPHIPNLHIHAESLLVLWDTYHVVLPKLNGYIVEHGRLNLSRFHQYLDELSKFEQSWFEEREADHRWMRGKRGAQMSRQLETLSKDAPPPVAEPSSIAPSVQQQCSPHAQSDDLTHLAAITNLFGAVSDDLFKAGFLDETAELLEEGVIVNKMPVHNPPLKQLTYSDRSAPSLNPCSKQDPGPSFFDDEVADEISSDDEDQLIYKMHRRDYYWTKLGIQIDSESSTNAECLLPLVRDYVRMLQWILCYYFLKVPDWRFFYAYHYAPFACDLKLYTEQFVTDNSVTTDFEWAEFDTESEPVLPFIQQLMIMPADAAYIVPEPYRILMTSPTSPLAKFFPEKFDTDINGKIASWEAVVLIPFVDEQCLLDAMRPMDALLTKQERQRNKHKSHFCHPGSQSNAFGNMKSRLVLINHSFFRDRVMQNKNAMEEMYHNPNRSVCPDFPSLFRLPFTTELRRIPVHIFESPSKLESMTLVIDRPTRLASFGSLEALARQILGRPTSVRWPHCATVMPVRLMSTTEVWELENFNMPPVTSSRPVPLRYRRIQDKSDQDTKDNANGAADYEASWVKQRLSEREHYLTKRWAIVLNEGSEDTQSDPVLVFSRKLDGWMIKRKPPPNNKNLFHLIPMFSECKAATGDQLRLTVPEPGSAWFHSTPNFRGRKTRGQRSNVPALRAEPTHGICDDLLIDLLDLILDRAPPMPSLNHTMLDWKANRAFDLSSIFQPGQVVISLASNMYGNTGEVVGISGRQSTVSVRFYPNVGGYMDISDLKQHIQNAGPLCYLPSPIMADQLGLHHLAVARLTGTMLVTLPANDPTFADADKSCGKKSQPIWNIGLDLRRNKSRAQVLGWSRYCPIRSNWLFSKRTLVLLKDYHERYPDLWDIVVRNSFSPSNGPIVANVTREKLDAAVEFLEQSGCRTAAVVTGTGKYLDEDDVEKLREIVFPVSNSEVDRTAAPDTKTTDLNNKFSPLDRSKWLSLPAISCAPVNLFMPINSSRSLYPSCELQLKDGRRCKLSSAMLKSFELMDRVVFCKSGQTVPLGLFGTVIGIPSDGTELVEVMFDKEFPGATDIRGSGPCCALVHLSLLIKLPVLSTHKNQKHLFEKNHAQPTTQSPKSQSMGSFKKHVLPTGSPNNVVPRWVYDEPPPESMPWPTTSNTLKLGPLDEPVQSSSVSMGKAPDIDDQSQKEIKELNALLFGTKLNARQSDNVFHGDSKSSAISSGGSNSSPARVSNSLNRKSSSRSSSLSTIASSPEIPFPPASWSSQRKHAISKSHVVPQLEKHCQATSNSSFDRKKPVQHAVSPAQQNRYPRSACSIRPRCTASVRVPPGLRGSKSSIPSTNSGMNVFPRFPNRQVSPATRHSTPVQPSRPQMETAHWPTNPSLFAGRRPSAPPPLLPFMVPPYYLPPGFQVPFPPQATAPVPVQQQFYPGDYYRAYMNLPYQTYGPPPLMNRPSGNTNPYRLPTSVDVGLSPAPRVTPRAPEPRMNEKIPFIPPKVARAQAFRRD